MGGEVKDGQFDVWGPQNVAPLVTWLASDDEVVRAELPAEWHAVLAGYVPEPFRNLG